MPSELDDSADLVNMSGVMDDRKLNQTLKEEIETINCSLAKIT